MLDVASWSRPGIRIGMTERAKFEAVALVHLDASYNLAFALLRRRADAEDAVQDAYLRALRAFHQLEGTDIKPWLLTIVRNVCYRRLQERRRAGNVISMDEALGPRPGASALQAELTSGQLSPEQAAISSSNQALVTEAIAALPPVFREVIVLREIEDMSYREIADVIGAPVGTVMSRLSRARTELRAILSRTIDRDDSNAL
jgi:RNA polymerase sigma-70 factor, ECF subfamily